MLIKAVAIVTLAGLATASWTPWRPEIHEESITEAFWEPYVETPYQIFTDHFSASRSGTDTYLYKRFTELYSNSSVTVTTAPYFQPLGFASAHSQDIAIKPMEEIETISRVGFRPPLRRRDGSGYLYESITFAGYEIAWKEYEFKAIVATWQEGFSTVTQWHIIGETPDVSKQFIHSVASWASELKEAILVFDQGWWNPDHNLWLSVQGAAWDDVILEKEFKSKVIHDYRSFFKSEKIYKDLEVPWKRGLIFLGPPGNGKTVSIKAIMNDVKVPILYVKSFHTYQGDEYGIRSVFTRARAEAPCVLIMEDLDSLITDQNRSFFLNEVDGIEDNDGLLLIGTTNHFDRLDPALSNRPSRFDRKYNFPNPSRDERKQYAVYWQKKLSGNKDLKFPDSLLDEIADRTKDFSFAYLKEAFVSALLTLAGREEGDEKLSFKHVILDQIKTLKEGLGKDQLRSELHFSTPRPTGPGCSCGSGCSQTINTRFPSFGSGAGAGKHPIRMGSPPPAQQQRCFGFRMPQFVGDGTDRVEALRPEEMDRLTEQSIHWNPIDPEIVFSQAEERLGREELQKQVEEALKESIRLMNEDGGETGQILLNRQERIVETVDVGNDEQGLITGLETK